jgi:hypothetical protein
VDLYPNCWCYGGRRVGFHKGCSSTQKSGTRPLRKR